VLPVAGPPLDSSLADVTFVVLDLETTGTSPTLDRITEIGALKLRGGALQERIDTLVNPGVPIPPVITILTGITEAMVLPAPEIDDLLPTVLEFLAGAVIVGHNIRFDCAFLDAACVAHGYEPLSHRRVDTVGLARRLVRDDVPNLQLHTLAEHYRTPTSPVHRAYADAAATAELFHTLLEHAATWGVFALDDLLAFPRIRVHKSSGKLALTGRLPRTPGVYVLRDRRGEVLYVGKATNLRHRVRSYFSGEDRRVVPQMVEQTAHIDHVECANPLESAVRELRLIERHRPRFNKPSKARRRDVYLALRPGTRPRVAVVRTLPEGESSLGPFSSVASARLARAAIDQALPALGAAVFDCAPCVLVEHVDAGAPRDALTRALRRAHAVRALRGAGEIVVDTPQARVELCDGRLVLPDDDGRDLPPHVVDDEVLIAARWLTRRGAFNRDWYARARATRATESRAGAPNGRSATRAARGADRRPSGTDCGDDHSMPHRHGLPAATE
jgi:DNA polymerase III epsilon subunit family exonuclease